MRRPPVTFLKLQLRIERWALYYSMRLFRLRDSAERVARGFALGMIVNFVPTFGLGFAISGLLARFCRGHVVAGLVGGASLTPFWPFLFYLNLLAGGWAEGRLVVQDAGEVTVERLTVLMWGSTFAIGCAINMVFSGLLVYGILYWLFRVYRARGLARFYHLMKRHQREVLRLRVPSAMPRAA